MNKTLFLLSISIIFAGISGCNTAHNVDTENKAESSEAEVVNFTEKDSSEIEALMIESSAYEMITVTGYIEVPPENRVTISPYHGGYVKSIRVLAGQKVEKGEVLFTLENPEFLKLQEEYVEAKEQLKYLKSEYKRQSELAKEKITSEKNFIKAESDYRTMDAHYQSLLGQLKQIGVPIEPLNEGKLTEIISIRSTMPGKVTSVHITRGKFAHAEKVAIEVVNTDHIHLELDVYEKDAIHVKKGQKIRFRIPESGTQTFNGDVHLVNSVVDYQKRTVQVHGHIEETDSMEFFPGMFVEAEIILN